MVRSSSHVGQSSNTITLVTRSLLPERAMDRTAAPVPRRSRFVQPDIRPPNNQAQSSDKTTGAPGRCGWSQPYAPVHRAARFCKNAVIPSWASSYRAFFVMIGTARS